MQQRKMQSPIMASLTKKTSSHETGQQKQKVRKKYADETGSKNHTKQEAKGAVWYYG